MNSTNPQSSMSERAEQKMQRHPEIKQLLFSWFKWRNKSRNSIPCALSITNDVVDTSRELRELASAAINFEMFRLERAISKLDETHQKAVMAVYGQTTWVGTVGAAKLLSISRQRVYKLLCESDSSISENIEAEISTKKELSEDPSLHLGRKNGIFS